MAELTSLAQLGQVFHFSSDDLRANREGKISLRQRWRLWRRFWGTFFTILALLLIPILVGWALVLSGTDKALIDVLFDPAALAGYITGFMLAGFYTLVNFSTLVLLVDMSRGRVRAVSGPVQRMGRYLFINKRRFLVEVSTLDLIQTGLHYTFYVLPGSQHILSVEFAE